MHFRAFALTLAQAATLLAAFANSSLADVKLPKLFSDHLVLQRGVSVPIWGTASPGEAVTVQFKNQTVSATADPHGHWRLALAPLEASVSPADLVVSGQNSVTLHDILVGEVWICSGQSNMEWPVQMADNAEQEANSANYPLIRHFKVERAIKHEPAADVEGSWVACSPETVRPFTAVGFFFARELFKSLNIPVGIINSSYGGTPIESWLSPEMLKSTPLDEKVAASWLKTVDEYPVKKAAYDQALAAWRKLADDAKAHGEPEPPNQPWRPAGPGLPEEPTTLWQGMIAPLVPFAARGFVWYQGESNVGADADYRVLFPTLINSWRSVWARGTPLAAQPIDAASLKTKALRPMAFLFVQLPNYADGAPAETNWALLREAQAKALALPATAMAVTIDVGRSAVLHPTHKQPVGLRLATVAREKVYGQRIEGEGPNFLTYHQKNALLRVAFAHAPGGLVCRDSTVHGFAVAGADHVFHPVTGQVDHSSVLLNCPDVPIVVAVRYAWCNDPQPPVNLFSRDGLPAVPFRTDNW